MIVVPMMDRQLTKVGVGEFAGAAAAYPWIDLEGLFPVALLALFGGAASLRNYPVQLVRIARLHSVLRTSLVSCPVNSEDKEADEISRQARREADSVALCYGEAEQRSMTADFAANYRA